MRLRRWQHPVTRQNWPVLSLQVLESIGFVLCSFTLRPAGCAASPWPMPSTFPGSSARGLRFRLKRCSSHIGTMSQAALPASHPAGQQRSMNSPLGVHLPSSQQLPRAGEEICPRAFSRLDVTGLYQDFLCAGFQGFSVMPLAFWAGPPPSARPQSLLRDLHRVKQEAHAQGVLRPWSAITDCMD